MATLQSLVAISNEKQLIAVNQITVELIIKRFKVTMVV